MLSSRRIISGRTLRYEEAHFWGRANYLEISVGVGASSKRAHLQSSTVLNSVSFGALATGVDCETTTCHAGLGLMQDIITHIQQLNTIDTHINCCCVFRLPQTRQARLRQAAGHSHSLQT
jgi:hypothetical protein